MKIILTFTLMMIPGVVSSISVTGYSGGGVTITCKYDRGYTANDKFFCKGQQPGCSDLIRTNEKDKWVRSGRFSLYDDTRSSVFTVTIRDLREQDSGTYQCGVDISLGGDSYTAVNLKVIRGQNIRSVRGYSGGNVIINYKYEMNHENHEKYFCKTGGQCFTVIITNRAAGWEQDRRFSVHDDRSAGLLRVFIRDLNENDSGKYFITVKVSEEYSFFSEFNLDIRDDDCCEKSISLSAAAGGSVNISCKYPQSHISDVKFLCWRSGADLCAEETSVKESGRWSPEGKIRLYDDREEQLLMGRIINVTEQHSEYWCGVQSDQGHKSFITRVLINVTEQTSSSSSSVESPVITSVSPVTGSSLVVSVSVVLLLIIIGLVIVIWTVCRRRQSNNADSSSKTSHVTPANVTPANDEAIYNNYCNYEEIEDTCKQLPTNLSDSSDNIYANV